MNTVVVPRGQEANALAGFLGLEEQPTKPCARLPHLLGTKWTPPDECDLCNLSLRVPLQSGDRVRFVTPCDICGGYDATCAMCHGSFELPLLRDGQPEVVELVPMGVIDRALEPTGSSWGWCFTTFKDVPYREDPTPYWTRILMDPEQFDSLAGCSWVLFWKEKG